MLAFLRRHAEILQRGSALTDLREKARASEQRLAEQSRLLRQRLAAQGLSAAPPEDAGLREVVGLCESIVHSETEKRKSREALERDVARLQGELEGPGGATSKRDAAAVQLARWREEWSEAVASLPVNAGAPPDATSAELERVVDVQRALAQVDETQGRIALINASCEGFAADAGALFQWVDPELARLPVDQAAAALLDRLTHALQADEARSILQQRLEEDRRRLADADGRLAALQTQLAALIREAGVDSPDALPEAERRSAEKRQIADKLADVESRLNELQTGGDLETFLAECAEHDRDAVEADVARLDARIDDSQRTLADEIGPAIGREQHALDQMDSSGRAAEAKEKAQDLSAKLATESEEFARLRLAQVILRKGIERYREKHQGPVVAKAGEYFENLTRGRFSGLRQDFDDDGRPILVGLRDSGGAVRVNAMSDGTADQLYLAIRLAWISDHLEHHEAIPVTADDVLIRFDDERSIETLKVLAELSQRTQVLLFTHHEHLLDLATRSLPKGTVFVHRLERFAP